MKQKTRFEVFKRDNFICQYCGRTPPEIILQVDHIIPKSDGGSDDMNNYITSCRDCNLGKGKTKLTVGPASIKANLKIIREKRRQLEEYTLLLTERERQVEIAIKTVEDMFKLSFPLSEFTDIFRRGSLKTLLTYLPEQKVIDAMAIACFKQLPTPNRTLRYFCGICWNWIKNPETREGYNAKSNNQR